MNLKGPGLEVFRMLTIFVFSSVLLGCASSKDVTYLNSGVLPSAAILPNSLTCQIGDILNVQVFSVNHDIVAPFNSFLGNGDKEPTQETGYLVSESAEITLPLVGRIGVSGLTLGQLQDTIAMRLTAFVKMPIVSVKLVNFRVTVLGDVSRPGLIEVTNGHMNVMEAIGYCGDMNFTGIRSDVIVVRNINGLRKEFHLDLTDKNVFAQSGFQLQQNDIVYVTPNSTKRRDAQMSSLRTMVMVSLSSLVISATISIFLR